MWYTDYSRSSPMWYNWYSGEDYMYGRRRSMAAAAMKFRDGWNGYWYDMENFEGRQYYVVCENFHGERDNMRGSMMRDNMMFNRRFHVASNMMGFEEGRSYCRQRGQYMAVPMNQHETDYIRTLLPNGDVNAWLGMYQNDDMWYTDYGRSSPMWYNWYSGDDYMYGRRRSMAAAAMRFRDGWNGYWYDMDNFEGRRFYVVCQDYYGERSFMHDNMDFDMERDNMMFNRHFHVASNMMGFEEGRSYCRQRGQYMAVPMNQQETDYIRSLLPNRDVN